jgi:hypothetical protein
MSDFVRRFAANLPRPRHAKPCEGQFANSCVTNVLFLEDKTAMQTSTATYRLRPLRTHRVYRLERQRPRAGLMDHLLRWWRRRAH